MDAGASIIGFVGFGLASIKTFYEFVSSIRDGPEKVRDLSRALASLQGAYERTKSLNDLPGFSCASPSLASLLERCNEDVARFEKKIGKLQIRPQDKFHGVLWKKLKMALGEDDIAYALDIISGYVNDITLEIGLIDLRFSHQNSTGIAQVIAEGEKQSITMSRISEGVFQSVTKIQQVHDVVDALAAKAAGMSSISLGQSAGIIERLARLEEEMASMRMQVTVAQPQPSIAHGLEGACGPAIRAKEVHHQGDDGDDDGCHDDAALSVKRLCDLLERKESRAESEEAQGILDDLDTLLQDLRSPKAKFRYPGQQFELLRRPDVDSKMVLRDIRQFRGILYSSNEISLNHKLPEQRASMQVVNSGKISKDLQSLVICNGQHGTWTISTRKRWRVHATEDGEKLLQDNTTSVFLRPRTTGSRYLIRATVRQFQQMYGFHLPTPTISISRMRPRNSRVFECVRWGLMDEFLQLLKTGEASLQDRDDLGASLLHYAAEQPEVSRFLIREGADVDDLAVCSAVTPGLEEVWEGIPITPLVTCTSGYAPQQFRDLLVAGADPTIEFETDQLMWELWHLVLVAEDTELTENVRSLIRYGATFFDLKEKGAYMIHIACCNSQYEAVGELIACGVHADTRDSNGRTCLHYLASEIRMVGGTSERDRKCLLLFLQNGADIATRDNEGRYIWDTVADNTQKGSYARDIWDSVLAHCGYHSEVEEYARTHPRHAVYTKTRYTRVDFEDLWKGMENLCPYYNDEELGLDDASVVSTRAGRRLPKVSNSSEISSEDQQTEESCTEPSEIEPANHHDELDLDERGCKTDESLDGASTGFAEGLEERQEQRSLLRPSVESWLSASNTPSNSSATPVEGYEEPASFAIWAGGNMPEEVFENPWA